MKNFISISISSFLMMCFSFTSLNIALEVVEYTESQSSNVQGSDDVESSSNKFDPNQNVFHITKANRNIEISTYVQELKYIRSIPFLSSHVKSTHGIRGPPKA
jgi:hypothetical protein